jgi:hypothetical protein
MDTVKYADKKLLLVINGSNLSKNATFKIQKPPLDMSAPSFVEIPKDVKATTELADPPGESVGNILKVTIPYPANAWPQPANSGSKYKLFLYNPDLQFAEWQFDFAHETNPQ